MLNGSHIVGLGFGVIAGSSGQYGKLEEYMIF